MPATTRPPASARAPSSAAPGPRRPARDRPAHLLPECYCYGKAHMNLSRLSAAFSVRGDLHPPPPSLSLSHTPRQTDRHTHTYTPSLFRSKASLQLCLTPLPSPAKQPPAHPPPTPPAVNQTRAPPSRAGGAGGTARVRAPARTGHIPGGRPPQVPSIRLGSQSALPGTSCPRARQGGRTSESRREG